MVRPASHLRACGLADDSFASPPVRSCVNLVFTIVSMGQMGMETIAAAPEFRDAVQVSGSVKWFDLAKGYGFITPSAGLQGDVLLHQSCVRQSGFKAAYEGARVVCEAVQSPKGLQARRVIALDNSTAAQQPASLERAARYLTEPKGPTFDATVK